MSIDKTQLRRLVREVLQEVKLWTPQAEELLMLTAAQESGLGTYLFQKGGPAVGIFQCEPRTYNDIIENYLRFNPKLLELIESRVGRVDFPNKLRNDLATQIIFARLVYLRAPGLIPKDTYGMARYWKDHYNTHLGDGTVAEAIINYKRYVES